MLFDDTPIVKKENDEPYKAPSISPFDFINAIHHSKENLIVDDWSEKQYSPYLVNRGLSFGHDTVIPANEMNSRPHLPSALQFQFLINIVKPKKRFNKWTKADKIDDLEVVKEYYCYSTQKAKDILPLLNEEIINEMKIKITKGGKK
jgi:hypothetical protein